MKYRHGSRKMAGGKNERDVRHRIDREKNQGHHDGEETERGKMKTYLFVVIIYFLLLAMEQAVNAIIEKENIATKVGRATACFALAVWGCFFL